MNDSQPAAEAPRSVALSTPGTFALDQMRDPMAGFSRNGSASDDSDGVPWGRYIDALKRHLILIVLITAVGSAAGFVLSNRVDPMFDVQSKIWINSPNAAQQANAPIQAQALLPTNSWVDLMRTFSILDPVVLKLKLHVWYRRPADSTLFKDFNQRNQFMTGGYLLTVDSSGRTYQLKHLQTQRIVDAGVVGDSIGRNRGFLWAPPVNLLTPNKSVQFSVTTPRQAAIQLNGSLRAAVPDQGQFLTLSKSGINPRREAATLNAVAQQLVNSATELKKHHTIYFRQTLAEQLGDAEKQLHTAETQLEEFRIATITLPSDNAPLAGGVQVTRDPVFTNFFQQNSTHDEVRRDREALERVLADAKDGPIDPQAFIRLPTIKVKSPELNQALIDVAARKTELRTQQQRYTDINPIVKNTQEAIRTLELETIPGIVRGVLAQLKQQEGELSERIASQGAQLKKIPPRTIEEMRLQRQVDASVQLANNLKAKYQQVLLAESETTPDLQILDTAVAPVRPTSNDGPRLRFLAILASFGAAVAFALLHDRLVRRFRYPEQATGELGLDIAGTVPRFKANRKGELGLTTMSQVVESFRTLRLGIRYQFQPGSPVVVAVTSPGAGEGKSLVSSNLAVAFANAGHKTLLIDGDVRRGQVHKVFDLKRCPGLVEYLTADASAETVVRPTPTDNLYLIPCGSRRVRAPELLVSDRMAALVNSMRQQFDVVIIDSPPFAAGMDAYALAAAAGSVLIVLRPAVTDRKLASVKLEVLDRLPVRVLGSVINGISPGGAYRYYGSDYNYSDEAVTASDASGEASAPIGVLVRN